MAIAKIQGSQRDFSAGEVDVTMKRADENPLMKSGARQCANLRILNSRAVQNRPGRSALFTATGRSEEITIAPGIIYRFVFGPTGTLKIFDSSGAQVFSQGGYAWATQLLVNTLVYAVFRSAVYICCQASSVQPTVMTFDGVSTWTSGSYGQMTLPSSQVRTPFYRLSPLNVTMQPSATSGAVTLTFNPGPGPAVPAMVGTRMRFCGREMVITGYTSPTQLSANVIEVLPPGQQVPVDSNANFAVGDVVIGAKSGAKAIVTSIVVGQIVVQLLNVQTTSTTAASGATDAPRGDAAPPSTSVGFINPEVVAGPGGSANVNGAPVAEPPNPVAVWDEEVINPFRGWPRSVFADQDRLGFCDIPALPNAILWSAVGSPTDTYIDAQPSSAILELAPDKTRVFYVVPGPESSEFVFTDRKVYYIPITAANPLKPGSVSFNVISSSGCSQVQPRAVEEVIIYMGVGGKTVMAVIAPGVYYRPYRTHKLSRLHSHLIKNPIAIAAPTAQGPFEEQYCYVLNSDGSMAVGKYETKDGQIEGEVGWTPWSGAGTVNWVAARDAVVMFSTTYAPNGVTPVNVVEVLDDTQYLDSALLVNSLPAPFTPPGGKGPLYVFPGPNSSVTLMDQVTRMMGTYLVDANGNIIPQGNGGENLAAATLMAGQPWTATLEPFVPDATPGGQDVHQRMMARRVARFAAYVSNSTGFLMARLFAGPLTRTSPALGTIMNQRRVTTWNQDDDPTQPPPLREEAQRWRPIGRAFDPRMAIIKDTPGPLVIHEVAMEATI